MKKKISSVNDNVYLRAFVIFMGMLISSIGINSLLTPAGLLGGGVAGLAVVLNFFSGINIGFATFLLNIPIFILGFKFLDKKFCIVSLVNAMLFSAVLGITSTIQLPVEDIFLQSVFGGICTGVGYGLVFKSETTLGGIDILGAILKQKLNIQIATTSLAINILVVTLGGLIFGIIPGMYTLVSIYISATVMGKVKDMMDTKSTVMLISDKYDDIAQDIMDKMKRGVTFIEAEGAYTKEKKRIVYCIVSNSEIPRIKNIALNHDEKAFISVNSVSDVRGSGFRDKLL